MEGIGCKKFNLCSTIVGEAHKNANIVSVQDLNVIKKCLKLRFHSSAA